VTVSYQPPKGWLFPTIEEIAASEKGAIRIGPFGSALKKHEYSASGIRVLGIEDVFPNELVSTRRKYIPEHKYRELIQYTVRPGDLLVTNMGTVGRACVVPGVLEKSIISSHLIKVSLDTAVAWPTYISWMLNFCPFVVAQVRARCQGAIMAGFNSALLKELRIPLPPLTEQRRITEVLDRAEALRAKRRAALAQLDTLTQSIFLDMFGDHRFENLEVKELCELVTDGTHYTPEYSETGVVFLSAKNVTSGYIDWQDVKFIPETLHKELQQRVSPRRNDILLAKNGTTGIAAIVDKDCIFDIYVSLALLRPKSDILPIYLHAALNSPKCRRQFHSALKGIGVPNLHLNEIRQARIPKPPIPVQQDFALRISAVNMVKAVHRKSLSALGSFFSTLQHRAFRGEL
jgi:type I restriction enzyme S subunit